VTQIAISDSSAPAHRGSEEFAHGAHASRRQIVIALLFTAAVLFATLLFYASGFDAVKRMDFATRYAAGRMVRQGRGAQLYDIEAQTLLQRDLFGRATPLLELHPPFEALLYAPISSLPLVRSYLVWGVFNIALWMAAVYFLRASMAEPKRDFQFLAACFTFFPLWLALHGGQTSILLLLSYALTLFSWKRGREFGAGACLGLGLCKFQLVLPFAFICALRGKWKFIAGLAAVAATLVAASFATVGPAGVAHYAELLIYTTRHPSDPAYSPVAVATMPTLKGFLSTVLGAAVAPLRISALVAAASIALLLYAAWRWRIEDRKPGGGAQDLMFAAALSASLLCGFYMFANDLSTLLPAMLLAFGSTPWSWRSKWHMALGASAAALYLPFAYLLLSGRLFVLGPVMAIFTAALFSLHSQVAPPKTSDYIVG